MAEIDPRKQDIARQCAKLFLTQMASVPADVQLMAIDMLARTIFINDIKPEKRLEMFDLWSDSIRKELLKARKKPNGKKSSN